MRVLIVDDSAESRERLRDQLGPEFTIEEAATAAFAVERARHEKFDVVLCDFVLPDADGVTVTKRLTMDGPDRVPVVGLSASHSADVAYAFLRAGASDFLCKEGLTALRVTHSVRTAAERIPIHVVKDVHPPSAPADESRAHLGERFVPPAPRGGVALVVDDAEDARFLLSRSLGRAGWRVVGAASGEEALAVAREAKPDIILLDYLLPDTDGVALVPKLREQGVTAPIVALTAHGSEKVAEAFLRAGAVDFIAKDLEVWTRVPFVAAAAVAVRQAL